MHLTLRAIAAILGVWLVAVTVISAIRNFVVPRGESVRIGRYVFIAMRSLFQVFRKIRTKTYEDHDRLMAQYAPFSLLMLPVVWLSLVVVGYSGIFWSIENSGWPRALKISGSSLFTLGFVEPADTVGTFACFTEAALGLAMVALLISYLPTIYTAFSRREAKVAMLEVRAGSPPSPTQFLVRMATIGGLESLPEFWEGWEQWFVEVEETHSSLSALVFFRSPDPYRSWVTASGVVLDSAALTLAAVDIPDTPSAALCIRSGFVALRKLASFYRLPYDADPGQMDSTSVSRAEFETVLVQLEAGGVPLKANREKAWRDFNGWRVNYDDALVGLALLTMAPPAPWTTDRIDGYTERRRSTVKRFDRLTRWR